MTLPELNEAREIQNQIRTERQRLEQLRSAILNIVPAHDGLPRAKRHGSKIEHMTIKIMAAEDLLAELKHNFETARATILKHLQSLPLRTSELDVVTLRYVACMSFREIQKTLRTSEGRVFKIHRAALKKILT